MTLGRRQIYVNFVAMRNMATAEPAKNRKVRNYGKGKTDERLIVLWSLFFFLRSTSWTMYDLEDLKTLAMHCDDDDEDVEDLLLLKYLEREEGLARAALRHRMHVFDFESLECKDFKKKFRFQKKDVPTLCRLLQIPDTMVGDNGTTWSGLEGMCILLRRLRFSGCLYDMDALFNRGEATISVLFKSMLRL